MKELHFACTAHNSSGPSSTFHHTISFIQESFHWSGPVATPGSHDEEEDKSKEEAERCLLHLACSHG